MTAIVVKTFNGIKPISNARLLDMSEAQIAENVRLVSGNLAPMRATTTLKTTVLSTPATIFRYGNDANEQNYWLEFAGDTDVMRSPIANDENDRLYWTVANAKPRYAPNSMILQAGAGAYPRASYELGIPKPSTAVTIGSYSTVPVYTRVTREYVLTFATASKESLPSSVISVQAVDGYKVAFTNLTTDNRGDAAIVSKKLYRKVSGTYRLVATIPLANTTYDDTATDASLSAAATIPNGVGAAPATPVNAPTVTAAAVTVPEAAISREYVYTIKDYSVSGEPFDESPPSPVATVSANSTQTVTISGLATRGYGGSFFCVYRKDSGSPQYQLVAEIPVATTTVSDPIALTTLGRTLTYDGPAGTGPNGAPTLAASAASTVTTVKRIYMLTFADASGNESAKGPSSTFVEVVDGVTSVTIVHNETIPAGVTKKRLYRQNVTITNGVVTSSDANWRLVAELTAGTTSTTDVATAASLTTALSISLQSLPPGPNGSPATNATIPSAPVPETRAYLCTYVSAYGEEGPPSDASELVEVDPSFGVTINLPGAPGGANNIQLKRIYRSSTVGTSAEWQYVDEIPVGQTSYVDTKDQDDLGENLPSEFWVGPPSGLKGLRLMANGAAVGFVGKTLYFSEPNLPHAWPHQYPIDEEIVGIGVFGQSVAVLTKSYPYLFQGIDPGAMASTKLKLPQACSSKPSIIETGDGVVYASPDGLVSIGNGMSLLTQGIYNRDQWQALNPSSMKCYVYNGRIILTYDTGVYRGSLFIDLSGQGALLTTGDFNYLTAATAGYYDAKTDTLYFAQGGFIVRFDRGTNQQITWRSKLFRLPSPESFSVAMVRCTGTMLFNLYADGALVHGQNVANGVQFRLPGGFKAIDWYFELVGGNEVSEVVIAQSSAELRMA